MRWMVLLCLLAGCALDSRRPQQENATNTRAEQTTNSRELILSRVRNTRLQVLVRVKSETWDVSASTLRVRLTVLELDQDVAAELCGVQENSIAPKAMGEPIALIACHAADGTDTGRTRYDATVEVALPGVVPLNWNHAELCASWWHGDGTNDDWINTVHEGVSGELRCRASGNGVALSLDTTSTQLLRPHPTFYTGGIATVYPTAVPQVYEVHRVAAETVRGGETAVFQLGQAEHYGRPRIRLLFVRIAESGS